VAPISKRVVESEEDWSDCNYPTYDPSKKLRSVENPPYGLIQSYFCKLYLSNFKCYRILKIATKRDKRKYKEMLEKNKDKATDPYYPGYFLLL